MSTAIQILSTLEYLGPYPDGIYFGLVLQVGTGEVTQAAQAVQVSSAIENLLKPWMWTSPVAGNWWPKIQLWKYANNGDPQGGDPKTATAIDEPKPTDIHVYDCAALRAQLDQMCTTARTQPNLSWVDPGQAGSTPVIAGENGYPWPALLAQVARFPYPIPHILHLSYLLKVSDASFTHPDSSSSYFASVTFNASINAAVKTYTPQISSTQTTIDKLQNKRARITIPYDDPSIFLVTQPLTDFTPGASVIASGLTAEVKDWQAHLVTGCADLFDLPARLLAPVRSDCQDPTTAASCTTLQQAVAPELDSFINAFLVAQRNLVSYGALVGPDGSSIVSRLSQRWIQTNSDAASIQFASTFLKAVKDQLAADQTSSDQSVVQDGWLVLLAQNPSLATSSLINPMQSVPSLYNATTAYKRGQLVLFHGQVFKAESDGRLPTPTPGSPQPQQWTQVTALLKVDPASIESWLSNVEHLQQQFVQNDVLSQLLLSLWDGLAISSTAPIQYHSFRSSASTALGTLNIRSLLLQGNLQASWVNIVADPSRENLRKNIPLELNRRMASLLNGLPSKAMSSGLQKALSDAAQAAATKPASLDTLVPLALVKPGSAANQITPPQQTRTSEGLSVLLGSMEAPTDTTKDADDDLRQMLGVCVLMREQSENTWRCLNVGKPMQSDDVTPAVTGLTEPVVVPVPQHTQDGMRRATLTYNNQPLMSESPAHRFGKDLVKNGTTSNSISRMLAFRHPSADVKLETAALQQWKIPGLAFSRTYDLLLGRVSNSGALPAAFTDSTHGPAVLSFDSVKTLSPSIPNIPYLRTVPVSGLRFGPSDTDASKIQFPPIPLDVVPRAKDLVPESSQSTPLLLLSPYKASGTFDTFSLTISRPTADLLTWDRWMAAQSGADVRALRSQVWSRYNILARQESSRFKVSLEDPAVRHLTITIAGIDGISGSDATDTKSWDAPWSAPDPSPLATVVLPARTPIPMTVTVSETATANHFDKSTWTLTVKPGVLGTITLVPSIDPNDQKLFASCIKASQLEGYMFIIETANKFLFGSAQTNPSDKEILRKAISILPPDGTTRTTIDFALTLNQPSSIGRVDLQTQFWRWDGRPTSTKYPYADTVMPPTQSLLEWELEVFSTRTSSDATTRPMSRDKHNGNGITFAAHEDRSADRGATFCRAAVTAYNRYGSMVPSDFQSINTLTEFASVPGADGGWVRSLIRAILPGDYVVPKPAIKFIVPLTGSSDTSQPSSHAASVLVVVQGPWYALGGLAEELQLSIAKGSQSLDQHPDFQEAGADPILFSGQRKDLPTSYEDYETAAGRLHGPVGHTFDQSDANPLWVYSSFVVDAPNVTAPKGAPQEGTFAALQFTRFIRPEGVVNALKSPKSEPTAPVWVQFLPSRFLPFTMSTEGLYLDVSSDHRASIKNGATTVTLSHTLNSNAKTEHLIFGLLLTEEVPDLLGRKGQERFCDVLLQPADAGAGFSFASWSGAPQPGPRYVGRILVIQRQVNTYPYRQKNPRLDSASKLWEEMFPGDDASDVSSRIVAVSPPISVDVSTPCLTDTGGQK